MSFVNQEGSKEFLCGTCQEIAHNATLLDCNLKHHNKQYTLYCSNCALLFTNTYKKCPFNDHFHPIFKAATKQRLTMNELDVICPYAVKEVIAKEHNEVNPEHKNDELFLYDTDNGQIASEADYEGTRKINNHNMDDISSSIDNEIGCEWIGKYKYLSYHIENECEFVPIQQQISQMKKQFNMLHNINIKNNETKSYIRACVLLNIIAIFIVSAVFVWFWIEIKDIKYNDNNINNDKNELDMNEINKYLDKKFDELISGKYEQINGYYYILKGDLDSFKTQIIESIESKLKDIAEEFIESKEEKESKYVMIDDILTNTRTMYDGYKKRIDEIPFVQFVSNTVNKFKEKKGL